MLWGREEGGRRDEEGLRREEGKREEESEEGLRRKGRVLFSRHSERMEEVFRYWLRTASDSGGRREEECLALEASRI